jgi:drug/metabolite transporter (DMT)-like permease
MPPSSVTHPIRKTRLDGTAMLLLLGCCLFWGLQQVMVKATIPDVASIFQAGLRFCGATILLLLWCRWRRIPLWQKPASGDASLRPGLLAGMLFAGEFAFLQLGLMHIPASRLTLFLYTAPFWVAALVPLLAKAERLRPGQWAGLFLAFAAVALALGGSPGQPASQTGDLLALAAGACWGLTTLVIRCTILGQAGAERILFFQVALSGPLLLALSWLTGESWHIHWTGFVMLSLLAQTAIGAFGSFLLWMWMLGHYPATRLSSFVFLTPVFALLFGALWLQEPVTEQLLLALAGVATGIVLVNRR